MSTHLSFGRQLPLAAGLALALTACGDEAAKSRWVEFQSGQGAALVVGQPDFTTTGSALTRSGVGPAFGNPVVADGRLYLSDYQHGRILGFDAIPTASGAEADFVIGAPDFTTGGELGGPEGLAVAGGKLFVADYDHDAIVVYDPVPTPGTTAPLAATPQAVSFALTGSTIGGLSQPESVAAGGGRLVVADSAHHRVLVWSGVPTADVEPDLVLGQADLDGTDENAGEDTPGASTLAYPSGVWTDGTHLVVLDTNNNRVLVWNTFPAQDGQAADLVLGQADFVSREPNRGLDAPTASTLNDPYDGVFSSEGQLFVADTDNGRVLVWNQWPTQDGQAADAVLGAPDLVTVGGGEPAANTFTAPTGVYLHGTKLIVGDSELDRYLVFEGRR